MQEHITKQFGFHAKKFLGQNKQYEHVTSPRFHDERGIQEVEDSIEKETRDMKDFFDGSTGEDRGIPQTKEELLEAIIGSIIARDFTYLNRTDGRPRSHEGGRMSAATDPFLSHLVYYGLQGHSTGMKEYDELFAEMTACVREHIKNGTWTPKNNSQIFNLITVYNEKHPEEAVSMDILTRTEDVDK